MSTPIRIKRSAVPGKRPQVSDLQLGELALNTYDGSLYSKRFRPGIGTDIIEFGGGYGGMCRLIRKMGFKGKYILYDLPELNLLQEYYLIKENCMENTVITNNFSIFNDKYDLLIATWSLSEIPLSIREKVAQSAKNFIMASQFEFAGIDNIKYFNSLKLDVFNIEHLPGNFYIMGVNK